MNSHNSRALRRKIQELLILEYTKYHDVQDEQISPALTSQLTDLEEKIKKTGLSYPEYNQIISDQTAGSKRTIYKQVQALAKLTAEKFPDFPLLGSATDGSFSIKKPNNLQKFVNTVKDWKDSDKEPVVQHQGLLSNPDSNPYYTYLKTEDTPEFDSNRADLVYYATKDKSTGGIGDRAEDALVAYYNILGQPAKSVQGKAPGQDITIEKYVIELKTAKDKGDITKMLNTSAIKPDIDKFYYFVSGRGSDENVVYIVNAMLLYVRNFGALLDVTPNADGKLEFATGGFEKKIRNKVSDELKKQNFEEAIVQTLLLGRPNDELDVKRSFTIGGLNVRFKLDFAIKQTDAASETLITSSDPEEAAAAIYAALLQTPAQVAAGRIGESVSDNCESLHDIMIDEQTLRKLVLELLARKLNI